MNPYAANQNQPNGLENYSSRCACLRECIVRTQNVKVLFSEHIETSLFKIPSGSKVQSIFVTESKCTRVFFHIRASDSSLKSGWPVMCTFCAHGQPMEFSGVAKQAEGWESWVPLWVLVSQVIPLGGGPSSWQLNQPARQASLSFSGSLVACCCQGYKICNKRSIYGPFLSSDQELKPHSLRTSKPSPF